jgi:hypothetical protein
MRRISKSRRGINQSRLELGIVSLLVEDDYDLLYDIKVDVNPSRVVCL